MPESKQGLEKLSRCLKKFDSVAIAVSGGVDSMTLAVLAHRILGHRVQVFHALSPAVPPDATARVRDYVNREGWNFQLINAGEFDDEHYKKNPANRCFFCKTNLYHAIASLTHAVMASGTNLDDLDDYRPGLRAAADHNVRHPYVEAGIDKQGVRTIARALELNDLAELPASPCLSSRIETGIAIDPTPLATVYAVEKLITKALKPKTVRCRLRRSEIGIELDSETLAALTLKDQEIYAFQIESMFREIGVEQSIRFQPYSMGSAFLGWDSDEKS